MLRLSRRIPASSRNPLALASSRAIHATSRASADVTLEIDGVPVTVPQGTALIQACEKAGSSPSSSLIAFGSRPFADHGVSARCTGATIPRFCYHDVRTLSPERQATRTCSPSPRVRVRVRGKTSTDAPRSLLQRLNIAGNCRMCLVEVSPGPPKPQASCALPAMCVRRR